MPPGCSVDAAVRIIAKPTMFEAAIPAIVSKLIRSRAAGLGRANNRDVSIMNLYPVFSYPDDNQCPQKGVDSCRWLKVS